MDIPRDAGRVEWSEEWRDAADILLKKVGAVLGIAQLTLDLKEVRLERRLSS